MIFAIIAAVLLIADQWLKYWVTVNITLSTGAQELIPGVVKLVNIHNSGAAFGILEDTPYARWIFLAITAVFVIFIAVLLIKRVFDSRFAVWCEVLFLTGALGNCIDRVFLGYVVDMFKLEFVNFAIFNIADVVLVVSCLLFVIYVFFGERDREESTEKAESAPERAPASEPVDDFAELFGINTNTREQPQQAEKITPNEAPVPRDMAFWDDFGPAKKAVSAAAAVETKPADTSDEYDLESILAEFKDL